MRLLAVSVTLLGTSLPAFSHTMTVGAMPYRRPGWHSDSCALATQESIPPQAR